MMCIIIAFLTAGGKVLLAATVYQNINCHGMHELPASALTMPLFFAIKVRKPATTLVMQNVSTQHDACLKRSK
ncbi:MAG: hypothetical protein RR431_03095 [Clostridia bacterium]